VNVALEPFFGVTLQLALQCWRHQTLPAPNFFAETLSATSPDPDSRHRSEITLLNFQGFDFEQNINILGDQGSSFHKE
jgi:hypothetical protein